MNRASLLGKFFFVSYLAGTGEQSSYLLVGLHTSLSMHCLSAEEFLFFLPALLPSLIVPDITVWNLTPYHVPYQPGLGRDRIVTEQGETRIMFSISDRELHPQLLRLHNKRCIMR